jgi:hypothetical protein
MERRWNGMIKMNSYEFGQDIKGGLDKCAEEKEILLTRKDQVFILKYVGKIAEVVHVDGDKVRRPDNEYNSYDDRISRSSEAVLG